MNERTGVAWSAGAMVLVVAGIYFYLPSRIQKRELRLRGGIERWAAEVDKCGTDQDCAVVTSGCGAPWVVSRQNPRFSMIESAVAELHDLERYEMLSGYRQLECGGLLPRAVCESQRCKGGGR